MTAPTIDAPDVKVLNRADLTKRLVAKLKCDEAMVGGIGNTNFDLYAAGHRLRISTCSAAWVWPVRSRSVSRSPSPSVA